jgi:hypothetical protein
MSGGRWFNKRRRRSSERIKISFKEEINSAHEGQ